MEADWEFEVGPGAGADAPMIEACWPGFVDLRRAPERAHELPEAVQLPALGQALARLNVAHSPVWTSKCDFWPKLEAGEFEAGELDAPQGSAAHATGCYIDLLPLSGQQWSTPELAAVACRRLCARLHAVPQRCCRADLVIRRARIAPDRADLGITAYLTACGATAEDARATLEAALAPFADSVAPAAIPGDPL